ncbi:MAG: hypothetical protein KC478_04600 [Bacteriovoracaceae bacterium]|nr:hypothetical protein [Bacteriovoracaceae bacterium]
MIRLIALLIFSFHGICDDVDDRIRVYLRGGYTLQDIGGNRPRKEGDFISALVGGHIHYRLSAHSLVGLNATVAFAPFRQNTRVELEDKEILGDAFIRTNYYSLPFYYRPSSWDKYYLGLGPALTLNHIQYKNFEVNEAKIKKRNRLLLKNVGVVAGLKRFFSKDESFVEANLFLVYWDELYLVDNSSLDAQVLQEDDNLKERINFSVSFSFGTLIF